MIAMGEETLIAIDPARLQADYDREGLFLRLRRLRAAAVTQGEPGLLMGTVATLAPFFIATLLLAAFGAGAA